MLQLQHLLSASYAALSLLVVVNPALLITYTSFSYGQSTCLQCYSVALYKRLFSGSVHTGRPSCPAGGKGIMGGGGGESEWLPRRCHGTLVVFTRSTGESFGGQVA